MTLPEGTTAYASFNEGGLRSMFQTDARQQGGVSAGVARLWQGRGGQAAQTTESTRGAPTYFPRSDGSASATATADPQPTPSVIAPAASAALVNAPLPPRRPAALGAPAQGAQAGAQAGAPLDLSLFTIRSGL